MLVASSLYLGYIGEISPKDRWFTKDELRTGASISIVFANAIA